MYFIYAKIAKVLVHFFMLSRPFLLLYLYVFVRIRSCLVHFIHVVFVSIVDDICLNVEREISLIRPYIAFMFVLFLLSLSPSMDEQ